MNSLLLRMKWYVMVQTLNSIQWHKDKSRFTEMNKWHSLRKYLHKYLSSYEI